MGINLRKIPFAADLFRYLRIQSKVFSRPKTSLTGFNFVGRKDQLEVNYEPQVADFLKSNIKRFNTFTNIGANMGYWPVLINSWNYSGLIQAVEPDKYNFKILRKNITANKISNIRLLNIAIGAEEGSLKLYGFGTGVSSVKGWAGGHSQRVQVVPMKNIDAISMEVSKPHLILIDMEGAEYQALLGAKVTLQESSEFLIEITANEHQPEGLSTNPNFLDTFEIFITNGFKVFGWVPEYRQIDLKEIVKIKNTELIPSIQMYHFTK